MNFLKNGEKLEDVQPALQDLHDEDGQREPEDRAESAHRVRAAEDGDEDGQQEVVGAVAGPDGVHARR